MLPMRESNYACRSLGAKVKHSIRNSILRLTTHDAKSVVQYSEIIIYESLKKAFYCHWVHSKQFLSIHSIICKYNRLYVLKEVYFAAIKYLINIGWQPKCHPINCILSKAIISDMFVRNYSTAFTFQLNLSGIIMSSKQNPIRSCWILTAAFVF